ncbi:LysR family transcriptional regulator [Schaedlerella arabinosiphila]|uniref:LysR family transcriptional regulator n=1 Tax=Schaedlerella arabinosiphila TaxID=2044587 RepID=A0A9X5CDA5_9FIRM|nr:LysR family transcriptional regulator [Schaedlerella arabinosiphila]KAI4440155.1 Hca operon transcriptional activator HcaR [Schaedlerella arabinosiphila]NDO69126.1 LysR family transcriptional regulator [Schaedlerella arabinosiphila]
MTIAQIKYFLAILEYSNFSNAAEEMYISQSSLSKQIKSLENELGITLFARSNNKVSLSPGGKLFYKYAKIISENYENLRREISALKEDAPAGDVSLGVLPLITEYNILKTLTTFQKSNNIQVNITEGDQRVILHLLSARKIDLAILRLDYISKKTYDFHTICFDHFVFVCSQKQREALPENLQAISPDILSGVSFVMLNKESDIYKLCADYFSRLGITPHIRFIAGRHLYLLNMVANDLGVTLLPRNMVDVSNFPNLLSYPLEEPLDTALGIVRLNQRILPLEADLLYHYYSDSGSEDMRSFS